MQLDFTSDGAPSALWTTDYNDEGEQELDVELCGLRLPVTQPGAAKVDGIGTGALVWQAGPALGRALSSVSLSNPSALSAFAEGLSTGRAIELGCGCSALPGVSIALAGAAAEVVLTDSAPVLEELQRNLTYYGETAATAGRRELEARLRERTRPMPLMWDDPHALASLARDEAGFALILCADVDYAETLHESLLDAVTAALAPRTGSAALFASAARCQRTLRLFLQRLRACFDVTEVDASLVRIGDGDDSRASQRDGVRYFLARWRSAHEAEAARARFLPPGSSGMTKLPRQGVVDKAVTSALDALDLALAELEEEDEGEFTQNGKVDNKSHAAAGHVSATSTTMAMPPSSAASAKHAEMPITDFQTVSAGSTVEFLTRCIRKPDRFFYPCNAKHRDIPARCCFVLHRPLHMSELHVRLVECLYSQGGTGWRVWPCALLLSCWLATHEAELQLAPRHGKGGKKVLEVGCGLGLPGLTAAALGARDSVLTDGLPQLLRTIEESVAANKQLSGAGADSASPPSCRVAMLDWDDAAPVSQEMADEPFSTEQGVKEAQHEVWGGASLKPDERFELILASDVLYSMKHAVQLPSIITERMAEGGRLAAMVPVRSEDHTRHLLSGLDRHGLRVHIERVTAEWVTRSTSPEHGGGTGQTCASYVDDAASMQGVLFDKLETPLKEGEILFVQAFKS